MLCTRHLHSMYVPVAEQEKSTVHLNQFLVILHRLQWFSPSENLSPTTSTENKKQHLTCHETKSQAVIITVNNVSGVFILACGP